MAPHRSKTSEIWNHFTEVEYQKSKCDHCSAVISTSGGSLGNLHRHMKLKHITIPLKRNDTNFADGLFN